MNKDFIKQLQSLKEETNKLDKILHDSLSVACNESKEISDFVTKELEKEDPDIAKVNEQIIEIAKISEFVEYIKGASDEVDTKISGLQENLKKYVKQV